MSPTAERDAAIADRGVRFGRDVEGRMLARAEAREVE